MHTMHNWYKSRPKRYVGCFLSRMLNWMWTSYNELRSILLIEKIERVQWEATNGKELQMMNQVESFDYFLKEGEKYLSMAHDLRDFNEKNSKLLPRVLRALDAYTRLNAFCKSTDLRDVVSLYRYEHLIEKLMGNKHEHNEEIVEIKDKYDGEIMKDEQKRDEIKQNKDKCNERIAENENKSANEIMWEKKKYDAMMEYEDIMFMFREREEKSSDQDDDYADSFLAKDYCVIIFFRQLVSIKTLVAQLQDLYATFNRRRLTLHILLADYCLKANSFLRRNAQLRSSRKLRRDKKHSMRCKYRHLEQLIARIIEEQNYMVKYIETAGDCRFEANAK